MEFLRFLIYIFKLLSLKFFFKKSVYTFASSGCNLILPALALNIPFKNCLPIFKYFYLTFYLFLNITLSIYTHAHPR